MLRPGPRRRAHAPKSARSVVPLTAVCSAPVAIMVIISQKCHLRRRGARSVVHLAITTPVTPITPSTASEATLMRMSHDHTPLYVVDMNATACTTVRTVAKADTEKWSVSHGGHLMRGARL